MKKILIALLVFTMVGCKDDKAVQEGKATQETSANEDLFKVTLDVVAKKDDKFHLFYTEDGTINFTEENSVWSEGFKGSENSQKIVFTLPKDKLPSTLRIDMGLTEDQGEIKINSLEMSYYGKTFTIPGADFFKYFRPNAGNTDVNVGAQTVKAVINPARKPGEPFSGPSVYPMDTLDAEIAKLTK